SIIHLSCIFILFSNILLIIILLNNMNIHDKCIIEQYTINKYSNKRTYHDCKLPGIVYLQKRDILYCVDVLSYSHESNGSQWIERCGDIMWPNAILIDLKDIDKLES